MARAGIGVPSCEAHEIDYNTQRPVIRVKAQRGGVKISGNKPGFAAMKLYSLFPHRGHPGMEANRPAPAQVPVFRRAPLCVPGTPEVRE